MSCFSFISHDSSINFVWFCIFAELPVLNQEHDNVLAAGVSNRALTRAQLAKQIILHSKENTVATTKSKKDTFVLECIDSAYEKSPNTTFETLNTNCVPVKNGSQLIVSDSEVTTKRTSQQEIKEGNEKTMPRETYLPGSINDTCQIVLATPKFHVTIPRRSKRYAAKPPAPSMFQTTINGVKNKVGKLLMQMNISGFTSILQELDLLYSPLK